MKKQIKTARGYRLYPVTQKMIVKIQKLLKSDADKAIASACEFYLKESVRPKNNKSIL